MPQPESAYPTISLPLLPERLAMLAQTVELDQVRQRVATPDVPNIAMDAPGRHTLSFSEMRGGLPLGDMITIGPKRVIQLTPSGIPRDRLSLQTIHAGNYGTTSSYTAPPGLEPELGPGTNIIVLSLPSSADSGLAGFKVHGAVEQVASESGLHSSDASQRIAEALLSRHPDLEGLLVATIAVDRRTIQHAELRKHAHRLGVVAGGILLAKAAEKDLDILPLIGALCTLVAVATRGSNALIQLVNRSDTATRRPKYPAQPAAAASLPRQRAPAR